MPQRRSAAAERMDQADGDCAKSDKRGDDGQNLHPFIHGAGLSHFAVNPLVPRRTAGSRTVKMPQATPVAGALAGGG